MEEFLQFSMSLSDQNGSSSNFCSLLESKDIKKYDNTFLNKMDSYEFNTFTKQFSKYSQSNENTLILSLMNIGEILSNNFIITEKKIVYCVLTSMISSLKFYAGEIFDNYNYAKYV